MTLPPTLTPSQRLWLTAWLENCKLGPKTATIRADALLKDFCERWPDGPDQASATDGLETKMRLALERCARALDLPGGSDLIVDVPAELERRLSTEETDTSELRYPGGRSVIHEKLTS